MKYGIGHGYWGSVWPGEMSVIDKYEKVAAKLRDFGFDMFEITAHHLYQMSNAELEKLAAIRKEYDLILSTNSGPPKEFDLSSADAQVRRNAVDYFKTILTNMKKVGSPALAGAIYSFWPTDFVDVDKRAAWERSIPAMKELGDFAEDLGIDIALEILNRNETYILTDCREAMEYCDRVGSKAVNILLDTYHMNIEEDDMFEAIRLAGGRLKHFHVGENNRKLPGMNNTLDWARIGSTLREIGYDKGVVMEPFLIEGTFDVRVWRDLSDGCSNDVEKMDALLKTALAFLKEKFEG